MSGFPIITLITLLPILGGLIILGLGEQQKCLPRKLALGFSSATFVLALVLWKDFDPASTVLQFVERHIWIPSLGVHYYVGVDGLGMLMVLLAAIVTLMAIIASGPLSPTLSRALSPTHSRALSPTHSRALSPALSHPMGEGAQAAVEGGPRNSSLYYALILFLEAGLLGTFTALNFFHWFIFWELSLIPAFFLVRLWGGPQRAPAATQFFVYTMVGSVTMLLAFLAIFLATSKPGVPGIFDFGQLSRLTPGTLASELGAKVGWLTGDQMAWLIFCGVLLGFAVKVPLMPFHTWLPAAYAEAPSPVTMLLTGVMSKMGVYGFVRILLPIFPAQIQQAQTPLLWLAVITIAFSAGAAFAQRDVKRILAYSSINHLGYCLLAVFAVATSSSVINAPATERAAALNGVFLQMFNHGLTAATLFWCVSLLEQRSGGLRGLNDFGGLRKVAPVFCGLMGIALFSSLGLPGLNGFVGEFLIFKGVFPLASWAAGLSVIGLLVTAIFILTILQRVFNGPLNEKWSKLPDLTLRERALLAVPIAVMFAIGLYPQLLLTVTNETVVRMVEQFKF